jgi:hypothetical protein
MGIIRSLSRLDRPRPVIAKFCVLGSDIRFGFGFGVFGIGIRYGLDKYTFSVRWCAQDWLRVAE